MVGFETEMDGTGLRSSVVAGFDVRGFNLCVCFIYCVVMMCWLTKSFKLKFKNLFAKAV
jgi:hypothetical protein